MAHERERLARAFAHEATDRRPCICPGGMMNMVTQELMDVAGVSFPQAHTDPELMARLAASAHLCGCFDNVGVPFCMTVEAESLGARVSLGTKAVEPHVTGYALDSALDWGKLEPVPVGSGRTAITLGAIKKLAAMGLDVPIVGNVTGPVSVASSVVEATAFYKGMRKHNAETHRLMGIVTRQVADFAVAQAEAGADVITIADPSGTGEILGPKLFEEFVVTYLNFVLDALAPYGVRTIVHICGQMHSVYDQLAEIKCDALSFDAVVSLRRVCEHIGNDRLIMGHVSTFALERGTPEQVSALTRASVRQGADIVAPACGMGTGTPLENVRAMLGALEEGAHA